MWQSYQSSIEVIGVGNLSVGGTGKTPFIAFLVSKALSEGQKVAIVSRGYGRKTSGLLEVLESSKAQEVGDEPLLLKLKFPEVKIWVCEKRILGVNEAEKQKVDIVFLDDNFQHRHVKADFQYMLSKKSNPFFKDYVVPAGRLREFRVGAKRADCIVFTHSEREDKGFIYKMSYFSSAKILFAKHENTELEWKQNKVAFDEVLAVSGIADSSDFIKACKTLSSHVYPLNFGDHHAFDKSSIEKIVGKYSKLNNPAVVCTEKDWVKLKEFEFELKGMAIAVLPVKITIIGNE